jgi:hypothetical protein
MGADTILLDTTGLRTLEIDAGARRAIAGAGLTWGEIQAEAFKHGLLGLSGTAHSVAICGYTFGGGLGWLTRPHGMASSALVRVEYVDGRGAVRVAAEDADDPMDRDALWAFRGGGGVGLATRLEFELFAVDDLWAGYLLWKIDDLPAVATAWADAMVAVGEAVTTSIAVLRTPPAPPFPEQLRGQFVVHLAVASSAGEAQAVRLLELVRSAAAPEVDTWGPSDVDKLVGIHLDPPVAVPAIGWARWLDEYTPPQALSILQVATRADSTIAMLELRNVGNGATAREGAQTRVPGPYIVHAVADLPSSGDRVKIDASFENLARAARPVDIGQSPGSFVDGAVSASDSLATSTRDRVTAIADAVDPGHVLHRSRFLG